MCTNQTRSIFLCRSWTICCLCLILIISCTLNQSYISILLNSASIARNDTQETLVSKASFFNDLANVIMWGSLNEDWFKEQKIIKIRNAINGLVPAQEYRSCLICTSEKQRALEQHWVFFQWVWEYMHSYYYFRYYRNIKFQQVLPWAFAKSLKTE